MRHEETMNNEKALKYEQPLGHVQVFKAISQVTVFCLVPPAITNYTMQRVFIRGNLYSILFAGWLYKILLKTSADLAL